MRQKKLDGQGIPGSKGGIVGAAVLAAGLMVAPAHAQNQDKPELPFIVSPLVSKPPAGQNIQERITTCPVSRWHKIFFEKSHVLFEITRINKCGMTLRATDGEDLDLEYGKETRFLNDFLSVRVTAEYLGADRASLTFVAEQSKLGGSLEKSFSLSCIGVKTFTSIVREGEPILGNNVADTLPLKDWKLVGIEPEGIVIAPKDGSMPWTLRFGKRHKFGELLLTVAIEAESGPEPGTAKITITIPDIKAK